ncbi:MAG: glycosyltransferase family 2 protein [Bacteroidota bacterium]
MQKVSIVLLSWNSLKFLKQFLPVLISHTPCELAKIIVVDNGSTDGTVDWLVREHSGIECVVFDHNLGYAGGYHRALKSIVTPYAVLLNSDVEVIPGWISGLLDFMEAHPKAGAVAPKILGYDDREHFEYAGAAGGWIDRFGFPFCRGRIFSSIEKDTNQFNVPEKVFWASGACLMVRMECYRQAGEIDPLFFAHMEEIDLCWRIHAVRFEVWYYPHTSVFHVGGGTLPNESPYKLFLNFRNNLLLLHKNLPRRSKKLILFTRRLFDWAAALQYLVRGKVANFKAVVRAHKESRLMRKQYYSDYQGPIEEQPTRITGFYNGSIVFGFFLRGVRFFSDLRTQR